jgi:hypothetical protein
VLGIVAAIQVKERLSVVERDCHAVEGGQVDIAAQRANSLGLTLRSLI